MKKFTAIMIYSLLSAGSLLAQSMAVASVLSPEEARHPAGASTEQKQPPKARTIGSYVSAVRQTVLAKFRPVARNEAIDFNSAEKYLDQRTTWDKLFGKKFEEKMRGEYEARVAPYEQTATHPIWRPRYWEVQRYEAGRKD